MKKKLTTILLISLMMLAFTITSHAETVSLLSSQDLTATPHSLFIKIEIQGADENRSRLQNQFRTYINEFKTDLIDNSNLTPSDITQSEIIDSSYIKKTGYNNPKVYQKKLEMKVILFQQNEEKIQSAAEEIIDFIADNNPRYHSQYNSLSELELNYEEAYYFFKNPKRLQEELLSNLLNQNRNKSKTLAKLLNKNTVTLTNIEEIKSADIANQKQKINLKQPQLPTAINLKATLRIDYQLK